MFKTITSDNGSEFAELSKQEQYGTEVYFAHAYSSYERPQNERHNRIFRNYVPKGKSIETYSAEQILEFADEMNNTPRKVLDYQTPDELFDEYLDEVYAYLGVQFEIAIYIGITSLWGLSIAVRFFLFIISVNISLGQAPVIVSSK